MREAGSGAAGFLDSIRKLGPCCPFFGVVLGPKLEPDHLKITKTWCQYIHFYFFPKSEPNIFILRRFFLIYWYRVLVILRWPGPNFGPKTAPKNVQHGPNIRIESKKLAAPDLAARKKVTAGPEGV